MFTWPRAPHLLLNPFIAGGSRFLPLLIFYLPTHPTLWLGRKRNFSIQNETASKCVSCLFAGTSCAHRGHRFRSAPAPSPPGQGPFLPALGTEGGVRAGSARRGPSALSPTSQGLRSPGAPRVPPGVCRMPGVGYISPSPSSPPGGEGRLY